MGVVMMDSCEQCFALSLLMGAGVTIYAGYLVDRLKKAEDLIMEYRSRLEESEHAKADYHDKWCNALLKLNGIEQ